MHDSSDSLSRCLTFQYWFLFSYTNYAVAERGLKINCLLTSSPKPPHAHLTLAHTHTRVRTHARTHTHTRTRAHTVTHFQPVGPSLNWVSSTATPPHALLHDTGLLSLNRTIDLFAYPPPPATPGLLPSRRSFSPLSLFGEKPDDVAMTG